MTTIFCLSSERLSSNPAHGFAQKALDLARDSYDASNLLSSPEKDVCSASTLKAAGAEIRSGETNVRCGFVPVAAPVSKRLALSVCLCALLFSWRHCWSFCASPWKLGVCFAVPKALVFFDR